MKMKSPRNKWSKHTEKKKGVLKKMLHSHINVKLNLYMGQCAYLTTRLKMGDLIL